MSKQDKVPVLFLKPWRGYNPDEVAGFPVEQAAALIDGKVAEAVGKVKGGKAVSRQPASKQVSADEQEEKSAVSAEKPALDADDDQRP